jgi:sirohydrochlorin ferrochelatase
MKSLVLVAHGSRRAASNDEVRKLADTLRTRAGNEYDYISAAFLELAEPSIPEGIEQAIQAGATEVVVVPYFLSAGRHVAEDIPAEVAPKQAQYPELDIRIADYLGSCAGPLADLLLRQAAG